MTGDQEHKYIFRPIPEHEETLSSGCSVVTQGYETTYTKSQSVEKASVTFHFIAPVSAEYYFHSPSPAPSEVILSIGDETFGKYLGRDTTHSVGLGWFEKGETVAVTLELSGETESLSLYHSYDYFYYLDDENFKASFEILKNNPQFMIEDHTDDHLVGTITTQKENQTIFTSIPYDEGWKIYLNGQEISYEKATDALITFEIDEIGTHTLEMKYRPRIYLVGIVISLVGLGCFFLLCLADWLFRKKRKEEPVSDLWLLEDFDEDHEAFLAISAEYQKRQGAWKSFWGKLRLKKAPKNTPTDENTPKGE